MGKATPECGWSIRSCDKRGGAGTLDTDGLCFEIGAQ